MDGERDQRLPRTDTLSQTLFVSSAPFRLLAHVPAPGKSVAGKGLAQLTPSCPGGARQSLK